MFLTAVGINNLGDKEIETHRNGEENPSHSYKGSGCSDRKRENTRRNTQTYRAKEYESFSHLKWTRGERGRKERQRKCGGDLQRAKKLAEKVEVGGKKRGKLL